jgi:hypothetical protein
MVKSRSGKNGRFLLLCGVVAVSLFATGRGSGQSAGAVHSTLKQYCFQCHGGGLRAGGIDLAKLTAQESVAETFAQWEKVAAVLDEGRMPPKGLPRPGDAERRQVTAAIRATLADYAKKHDGDPGPVTVRRLTSGEYAYTIEDLTGVALNTGIDSSADSAGGEGFTNFGDVQFMQDVSFERYLRAAKTVAGHAVIGAGPIEFFRDAGETGFELSAITRIRDIYAAHAFRTVSGEGGRPFGLERYGKALYAAWRYKHRAALGEPKVTLKQLAAREGVMAPFVEHIWTVMNNPALGYPSSEVAARWRKLPAPGTAGNADAAARKGAEDIQTSLVTWRSWGGAAGGVGAGG